MRILKFSLLILSVLLLGAFGWGYSVYSGQGVSLKFWETFKTAKVTFDEYGIPTISADNWGSVVEAQGYLVASERLFQMDLIRRKASGRLAEWFGKAAAEHDVRVRVEDRIAIADRAAETLPRGEWFYCDAYTRGVNRFITENRDRWGVEYRLLDAEPEPWQCRDTLLVILVMAEELTATAEREAQMSVWASRLPAAWRELLFPQSHPWNEPLIGTNPGPPKVPPADLALPRKPISPDESQAALAPRETPYPVGSNNWAYRGSNGFFLANDPHLGQSVPGTWYALRLKVSPSEWAVGVTIPGIPGLVLGMNPHLAWAFTNTGEDVDDYLAETLSEDGAHYLVRSGDGIEVWETVKVKDYEIVVRGEQEPRRVKGLFTHRGPLVRKPELGKGLYSRQWLPLKDGILRVPSLDLMVSKSLEELDRALDKMTIPAQNVLAMDRAGRIRFRVSGTGVVRKVSGRFPQPANVGEWLGFAPMAQRPRVAVPDDTSHAYLATANQRIWVDDIGHFWFSDDRQERIMRFLAERPDLDQRAMEELQLDTESRFRKLLIGWIRANATVSSGPLWERMQEWQGFDGTDQGANERAFTDAGLAESALATLLVNRVRRHFLADEETRYYSPLERAWLTVVLTEQDAMAAFGLSTSEVADFLLKAIHAAGRPRHAERNRWKAQHPFFGRVPVIGALFEVDEPMQFGASDVVLAERGTFGPSVRLVWNLSDPARSTWILPVGQSGHVASPWYRNLQRYWHAGKRLAVFPDPSEWTFGESH